MLCIVLLRVRLCGVTTLLSEKSSGNFRDPETTAVLTDRQAAMHASQAKQQNMDMICAISP